MDFLITIPKLLILFAAIAVAFIAAKCGILTKDGNKVLSRVVIYILNPAMVIASSMTEERILTNGQVLLYLLIACITYGVLIVFSRLIPVILRVSPEQQGLYRFMFIFSNIGFFGMPAVKAIFGEGALFLVVIFMFPFQFLTYTYGITLISGNPEDRKLRPGMLLHPMILSCLVAFLLYFLRIPVPTAIRNAVTFLSDGCSPLAMIVVGSTLAFTSLKKVLLNWRQYALAILKMLVFPLAFFLVLRPLLPQTEQTAMALTICAIILGMPTAANAAILSTQYNGDTETASGGIFIATVLSAVSVPFLVWLLNCI